MAAELTGIIGGTGLGDALQAGMQQAQRREVDTPFGPPSGAVTLGKIGGREVAFLNRHGVEKLAFRNKCFVMVKHCELGQVT